jgi:hypothetical protein
MRVNKDEWGVIHSCALQKGARISEVMRDALRMYMQRNIELTCGEEFWNDKQTGY